MDKSEKTNGSYSPEQVTHIMRNAEKLFRTSRSKFRKSRQPLSKMTSRKAKVNFQQHLTPLDQFYETKNEWSSRKGPLDYSRSTGREKSVLIDTADYHTGKQYDYMDVLDKLKDKKSGVNNMLRSTGRDRHFMSKFNGMEPKVTKDVDYYNPVSSCSFNKQKIRVDPTLDAKSLSVIPMRSQSPRKTPRKKISEALTYEHWKNIDYINHKVPKVEIGKSTFRKTHYPFIATGDLNGEPARFNTSDFDKQTSKYKRPKLTPSMARDTGRDKDKHLKCNQYPMHNLSYSPKYDVVDVKETNADFFLGSSRQSNVKILSSSVDQMLKHIDQDVHRLKRMEARVSMQNADFVAKIEKMRKQKRFFEKGDFPRAELY